MHLIYVHLIKQELLL
ncbi:UNVERIFIED_CONTAM: hypothetical protein GTU68_047660 [Idotea baltica]|nr:hypothetical protein [Idotea baltica]